MSWVQRVERTGRGWRGAPESEVSCSEVANSREGSTMRHIYTGIYIWSYFATATTICTCRVLQWRNLVSLQK